MKNYRAITLLMVLSITVPALSASKPVDKPTIAVLNFGIGKSAIGTVTVHNSREIRRVELKVGYETSLLTDKFIVALSKTQKLVVVEREKLTAMLEEANLSELDMTDPHKSVKIGKLLGADYLLMGTVSMLDGKVSYKSMPYNAGSVKITEFIAGADLRIVQTETGRIMTANSQKAKKVTKDLNSNDEGISAEMQHEVYDELVSKLVDSAIETLFPVKVASFAEETVYLNRGDLKIGNRYAVFKLGNQVIDPDSNEVLGQIETKLANIEITEAAKGFSKAKVLDWAGNEKTIPSGAICRTIAIAEIEKPIE